MGDSKNSNGDVPAILLVIVILAAAFATWYALTDHTKGKLPDPVPVVSIFPVP